jgi:hypothetical protein
MAVSFAWGWFQSRRAASMPANPVTLMMPTRYVIYRLWLLAAMRATAGD